MSNIETLPAKREPLMAGAPIRAIIPQSMEDAFRIATAVVASGMAPADMKTPEKCLIAIMQGLEVGMTPLQSIQRIAVINGRPTIWGDAAIGLVRASGLCEYIKEWLEGDGDKMVAHCEAKRKGEKEPIKGSFSVADAKKAKLWGKAGTWQQYDKRMLQMRARGFTLRDGFADVLGGMYLREEMEGVEAEIKDVTPLVAPPAQHVELEAPPAPKPEDPSRRKKGEPRTSTRAYYRDGEPTDAEIQESQAKIGAILQGAPMSNAETDKYLADLEDRLKVVSTLEDVTMIEDAHVEFEEQRMFPPDRTKATKLIEEAKGRFEQ